MLQRWLSGLVIGSALVFLPSARADVLRVSTFAPPAGQDGRSWSTAFVKIQDAVDAASSGDEVWVAEGAYNATVTMKEGVSLYGGFAGSETAREQRNTATNPSILDGTDLRSGLVLIPAGATAATVLDGFTLRNAYSASNVFRGGGVTCMGGSPVISNNRFWSNYAQQGGGVYCSGAGSPRIVSNVFEANVSINGAAVCALSGATPIIEKNEIRGNNPLSSQYTQYSVVFLNAASAQVLDNAFTRNGSTVLYATASSPMIAGNSFRNNLAPGVGVAVTLLSGSPIITRNVFQGNEVSTTNQTPNGSAIHASGTADKPLTLVVSNNLILGNATTKVTVYVVNGSGRIVNNTIVANAAPELGAAIALSTAAGNAWTLANNIIAFNKGKGIQKLGTGLVLLRHNDVYENAAGNYDQIAPGATDIQVDPDLPGLRYADLRPAPDAPVVNAGSNPDAQDLGTDFAGNRRIVGPQVDIGAYESNGQPVSGEPRVMRVSPNGDDTNTGDTWAAAKKTVQAAVDALPGGEVWAAEGVYPENLRLSGFVYLYGGFAGTETSRDSRNWSAHRTVLDGAAKASVISIAATATRYVAVDGFTIRNGKGTGGAAGIDAFSGASPTVEHNLIAHNDAPSGWGGLRAGQGSVVRNNVFFANSAGRASAASLDRGSIFTNNTVVANSSPGSGSAEFAPACVVVNNIFAYNAAGLSPGAAIAFRNNNVFGNRFYDYNPPGGPGEPSAGNISQDPRFADWRQGNLHIQPDSPCVDSGDDAFVETGDRDMDVQPRVQGARVDMGADESDGTAWNVPPRIVRVSTGGDDANDGSAWSSAKKTVGAAIAAVAENGGEVWVAGGTYTEAVSVGPLTRVYGGFAGSETERDQRNPKAHTTTLQNTGIVVTFTTGALHSVLDGFKVAGSEDAGIASAYAGQEEITGNEITGNATGIRLSRTSYATISRNHILQNTADGLRSLDHATGFPVISANVIEGNGGAGMMFHRTSPTVDRNVFRANANGGLILDTDSIGSSPRVTSNLFVDNGSPNALAGGIRVTGPATVANNTIVGNHTGPVSNKYTAAGIFLFFAAPNQVLANNIVAFNTSGIAESTPLDTGGAYRNNDVFGNAEANYYGRTDPTGANGNISTDPRFVDRSAGNYRLLPGSPAVDAGDDTFVRVGALDLDGSPRILGAHVDLGAYEAAAGPKPADAVAALRIAAGLETLALADKARLDVEQSGGSSGVVDLLDALALLRHALGAGG